MIDGVELLPYDFSAVLYTDFIPAEGREELTAILRREVPWRSWTITMFGKSVVEPRLSAWVADPDRAYKYSGQLRHPEPWTPALNELRDRCSVLTGSAFNSVLANLYRDGRDSMGWHADNERANGVRPTIASLSLGAERRFDLRHVHTRETVKTILPSGSLLVMSDRSQSHWVHQIPRTTRVNEERINLTFRYVFTDEELRAVDGAP